VRVNFGVCQRREEDYLPPGAFRRNDMLNTLATKRDTVELGLERRTPSTCPCGSESESESGRVAARTSTIVFHDYGIRKTPGRVSTCSDARFLLYGTVILCSHGRDRTPNIGRVVGSRPTLASSILWVK